jgi:hypothetical protein
MFETQQDINVVPTSLIKWVAFDPVNYSDYTAQARGEAPGPFAAFQGQQERERTLYLGDDELLAFPDESSRQAATITLSFQFAAPGNPTADGWRLEWLYWDGASWAGLENAGAAIADSTNNFSQDGEVLLENLPELAETEVAGQSGLRIACQLTGGSARNYLPALSNVGISRRVDIEAVQITADAALSAIHSGTAFVPLDPGGEFFPLGQRPGRLDTFYLRADEAFTKGGASVEIAINLEGVPERDRLQRTSDLEALTLQWEYYSSQGWTPLGTSGWNEDATPERLDFGDTTRALTTSGSVTFNVPQEGQDDPPFGRTTINGQEGYWLRARVTAGSYDEPGGMFDQRWSEPRTHAPLITSLVITYSGYSSTSPTMTIPRCLSRVDDTGRDHAPALAVGQPFAPFDAVEEGPALYLGFSLAFPAGEWVQILLDVAEEVQPSLKAGEGSTIFWEYWNSSQWSAPRLSDNSRGLRERGYLGFFGPDAHQPSTEFGQSAYWLRARPPRPPQARAGSDQTVTISGPQDAVTLDASGSQGFDRQTVSRYVWWLVSSTPPVSNAGQDIDATNGANEATVALDASASQPAQGRPVVRYIWRLVEAAEAQPDIEVATPYLNSIRTNIVPALNAVTVRNEVLGSSNGKANQAFSMLRTPALPGLQIAVREPDRPPSNELEQLQRELGQEEGETQALLDIGQAAPGQGVWVRWHQVEDFYFSNPSSRHFTLDPISGQIRFGDGSRGKVPPAGRDNIRALIYRTHNGVNGNVATGNVTVLRNPRGDLANIKTVTNHEATGGGANAEPVEQVKLRGPQTLKHRQRAVTVEDYEWLAREAGGDLAQVRCLPARNPLGLPEAGWVTMVITPESVTDKRPTPTPALLRRVESYLKGHALPT